MKKAQKAKNQCQISIHLSNMQKVSDEYSFLHLRKFSKDKTHVLKIEKDFKRILIRTLRRVNVYQFPGPSQVQTSFVFYLYFNSLH